MIRFMTVARHSVALVLVLAAGAAGRDSALTVHQRLVPPGDRKGITEETEYYSGNKLVIDSPTRRWIVDLDAKTATNVDKDARSYTVSSLDAVQGGKFGGGIAEPTKPSGPPSVKP